MYKKNIIKKEKNKYEKYELWMVKNMNYEWWKI